MIRTVAVVAALALAVAFSAAALAVSLARPNVSAQVAQLEENDRSTHEQATAALACLRNNAYTRVLLGDCVDDWYDAYASTDH